MSVSAREAILGAIRNAFHGQASEPRAAHAAISRDYVRRGTLSAQQRMELLLDRLLDYDTELVEVENESQIASAIARSLEAHGESALLVPEEFPQTWLPADRVQLVPDDALTTQRIEPISAVVTTCEVAVAATGTIFLVHGGAQGRRVLTLLPDHHICLLHRDQIVETVPEALEWIAPSAAKPITTISGPSATSDIEMTRIRGVHGPRTLTVILYGELATR